MTQQYYSLITNNGLLKEAAANGPGGSAIDLTHIAVGDANGTSYNPTGSQTALVHEVYRTTLTHVAIDVNNPDQLIVEGVISEEVGSFYIREVGIFDSDGQLFAIGKYPETYKSTSASGSGKRLYIRMILGFANAPQVSLVISEDINNDPNFSDNVNNALADINDSLDVVNDALSSINSTLTSVNNSLTTKLVKTANLSDLSNVVTARDNLGLKNGAISDFTGAVIAFAMSTPPTGWLECNGASLSRTTYANLFGAIGTTYGNIDGSTFKVPDLRGEFIRGWDHSRGVDSGRSFASSQSDAFQGHYHKWQYRAQNVTGIGSSGDCIAGTSFTNNTQEAISDGTNGTPRTAAETRPRNIAMMYCIKY
jgi:phage-related tail fiber protein